MKFRVEMVCINDAGQEHRSDIREVERRQLAMETLGLNLCESKAMLESVQEFVVARQTAEDWEQRCQCPMRRTLYRQGRRDDRSEDVVWNGRGSQSAMESVRVSAERP